MAFPSGWTSKNHRTVASALPVNAPALFTAANLPAMMFDADGPFPALNGGGDIRFSSDAAGATRLPCEVVSFVTDNNPANGSAQIWVKTNGTTSVYVWWGKAGETQPAATDTYGRNAVWSEYLHRWHLEQEPANVSGEIVDSTGNLNLTGSNMSGTDLVTGTIGNGIQFSGTSEQLQHRARTLTTDTDWEVPEYSAATWTNTGLCWDSTDDCLWCCDWTNGRVVKLSTAGAELDDIVVGSGASLLQGIAYDSSDDTLWIASYNAGEIWHYQKDGTKLTSDTITLANVNGLAYEAASDSLWVTVQTEAASASAYRYSCSTRTLQETLTLAAGATWHPAGDLNANKIDHVCYEPTNDWLLINHTNDQTYVFSASNGALIGSLDNDVDYIEGMAFDESGNLWTAHDGEYHGAIADGNRIYRQPITAALTAMGRLSSSGFAIGGWLTISSVTPTDAAFMIGFPVREAGAGLYISSTTSLRAYAHDGATQIFDNRTITAGKRHCVVVINQSADQMTLWVDGSQVGAAIDISSLATIKADWITLAGDPESRNGAITLDEVWVYDGVPTSAWIAAEFNGQNSPGSVWSSSSVAHTLTPGAVPWGLSAPAPTVLISSIAVTPAPAAVTIAAGTTPSVVLGSTIATPAAASVAIGTTPPTVALTGITISPAAAASAITASGPTILNGTTVSPPAALFIVQATSPAVIIGSVTAAPAAASVSPIAVGPTIISPVTLSPDSSTVSFASPDAVVILGALTVSSQAASLALDCTPPVVIKGSVSASPDAAAFVFAATSPGVDITTLVRRYGRAVAARIYQSGALGQRVYQSGAVAQRIGEHT